MAALAVELGPSRVVLGHDACQADQSKPHAAAPEQLAAVERTAMIVSSVRHVCD